MSIRNINKTKDRLYAYIGNRERIISGIDPNNRKYKIDQFIQDNGIHLTAAVTGQD
jgi:hypothetical protein